MPPSASFISSEEKPDFVDTVVIGNGPSALILSYILNGHIPRYCARHDDELLHGRLKDSRDLLQPDPNLFHHLQSSVKYSSAALPINVLLDTLARPDGDLGSSSKTCIRWEHRPEQAISHRVLGDAARPGGQWVENPMAASPDIGSLSYAEQLSLPGYTFADHWGKTYGERMPDFMRPTRTQVADYFATYPRKVGIDRSVDCSTRAEGIFRTTDGFNIVSHNLNCKHLVLASGTFSHNLPPKCPLGNWTAPLNNHGPILVVGSGFTAADIIISTPPERRIIHLYHWDPENRPSPLRACHSQAYPEYAGLYRMMKLAAEHQSNESTLKGANDAKLAKMQARSTFEYFKTRVWTSTYVGYPNGQIMDANPINETGVDSNEMDKINVRLAPKGGPEILEDIFGLYFAIGRRGSLSYLAPKLLEEVVPQELNFDNSLRRKIHLNGSFHHEEPPSSVYDPWGGDTTPPGCRTPARANGKMPLSAALVSGHTLRPRIEESNSIEVAPNVFVIGSLTGDSLVRFALGGCCVVAGRVLDDSHA